MIRVWYHKNCLDGFTAAWAAYKKLGDGEGVLYEEVQYGDPVPDYEPGDCIYILDFSFPRQDLLDLRDGLGALGELVVLDHHKSAMEDLEGLPFCTFDMEKSGCRLAWEYFHPLVEVPYLLECVEDRDLWRFAYGDDTRAVCTYLSTKPKTFEEWDRINQGIWANNPIINAGIAMLDINAGLAMLDYQAHVVKEMAAQAEKGSIGGYPCMFVTAPTLKSEVCHYLLESNPDIEIAVGVSMSIGSPEVFMSLRSRKDGPDVSAIAKMFGGGGHKNAAGAKCNRGDLEA